MKQSAILFILAVLLICSCKKKEDTPQSKQLSATGKKLVGTWKETHYTTDLNGNMQPDSVEKTPRNELAAVNFMFAGDGSGYMLMLIYSYPDYDSLPIVWELKNADKEICVYGMDGEAITRFEIISLSDKEGFFKWLGGLPGQLLWNTYQKQ